MELTIIVIILLFYFKSCESYTLTDFPNLGIILTSPGSSEKISLKNLNSLPNHPYFNKNFKTVLYFFGYTQFFEEKTVQTIMDAYHIRGGFNFLVGDWYKHNEGDYFQLRQNLSDIGKIFGKKLFELEFESNFTLNIHKFHFIGHSMGAHLAANVVRGIYQTKKIPNIKVDHITALDPAGVGFYDPISYIVQKPLSRNDAKFVDVIYTDSIYFGTSFEVGHVNFWPNDGKKQPNCPNVQLMDINANSNYCSHQRSTYYFAESVATLNEKAFHATKCNKFLFIQNCKENPNAFMGFHVDKNIEEGNYYLKTNGKAPFNIGDGGIVYYFK